MNERDDCEFIADRAVFRHFLLFAYSPTAKAAARRPTNAGEFEKGDKIVTIGGLHGIIDSVDEDKIIIRAGDGTRLTYDRSAVREVVGKQRIT